MPDWPHAPAHRLGTSGAYIVTAGIYQKAFLLASNTRKNFFQELLFKTAKEFDWQLQAWAILANHYHLIVVGPGKNLSAWIKKLHASAAKFINQEDQSPGRKVWHQYWETHLTFEKSYYARLRYVHQNPVRHGAALNATNYPWCSASWFEQKAERAFVKTVESFSLDHVQVEDDF